MRYPSDEDSSHEYEVKRFHFEGKTVDGVVFYLRADDPVHINIIDVFKKTGLWGEPTESWPKREHHVMFEVEPVNSEDPIDLYLGRYDAELERSEES